MDCLLYGTEQSFQWATNPTPPPMALLSNVLSWETSAHKTSPTSQSSANILGLVQQSMLLIDNLPSASVEDVIAPSFIQKFIHLYDEFSSLCRDNTINSSSDSSAEVYINECCRQTALLHWRLVNNKGIFSTEDTIPADGKDLKVAMGKMDIPTWSKVAPRVFIWAGVTGAAASKECAERAWFAARLGPVVMAQGKDGIPTLKQGMALYHWLKAPVPVW